jgi:hypothetical protein
VRDHGGGMRVVVELKEKMDRHVGQNEGLYLLPKI